MGYVSNFHFLHSCLLPPLARRWRCSFNNGTFFLCIDPTVFRNMDDFLEDIELMKRSVRNATPREEGAQVFLPGEPELALEVERRAHGIPVPGRTWHGFEKIATKLGVALPLSLEELAQPVAKL
jgi:LDH2 family malate/lactate/ureidoglycolate dehydrogenase